MFVGRKPELEFLKDRYASNKAELIVIYGRRRVGKTELLRHFCKDKQHVYHACNDVTNLKQLEDYSKRILNMGIPSTRYLTKLENWEDAFSIINELPFGADKKIVVIDEFPYMCKANPSIPSILQNLWDEQLKHQNIMLILSGSAISFIEKELLSSENPLYGRATGIYKIKELPFHDATHFFKDYNDENKIIANAVLGGIPHYLSQFDHKNSLKYNIIKYILTAGAALNSEVEFFLRQELREPAMYNTIVEAIALGNTKLNDIYNKTGSDKNQLSVYLKNLINLDIVEREFPITATTKDRATSTKGLYRIKDNFFRFWYHFAFPNISDIEAGDVHALYDEIIEPELNNFSSLAFESVCREYLRQLSNHQYFDFKVNKIGRWWGKISGVETEIDIVAYDRTEQHYILGECKFKNTKMNVADAAALKSKSGFIKTNAQITYTLFSKSGFTDELIQWSNADPSLHLIPLKDIVA